MFRVTWMVFTVQRWTNSVDDNACLKRRAPELFPGVAWSLGSVYSIVREMLYFKANKWYRHIIFCSSSGPETFFHRPMMCTSFETGYAQYFINIILEHILKVHKQNNKSSLLEWMFLWLYMWNLMKCFQFYPIDIFYRSVVYFEFHWDGF